MPSTALDPALVDPVSSAAVLALVASLGLSTVAGLRAAAVLFAVGLASDIQINGHPLLPLHGSFQVLGSTPMLIVLGIVMVAEFVVDKFPGLDHVNDIISTVIRPVVGAVVVAGTANTLSDENIWVAAIVGALLALATHGVKTTTRVASTATTAGVANPVLSVGEDVLTVGSIVLLILAPVAGVVLVLILLLIAWRVFARISRWRRRSRERNAAQAATDAADTADTHGTLDATAISSGQE